MADDKGQAKRSDLKVRFLSALAMLAVAGGALWLGSWVWVAFVAAVAAGVIWEWWGLVQGFVTKSTSRALWMVGALVYVAPSVALLAVFRLLPPVGWVMLLVVLFGVIGCDVGAYFAGRTIGGPKIAPSISPSKTWSGLGGGMLGASAGIALAELVAVSDRFDRALLEAGSAPFVTGTGSPLYLGILLMGAALAVIAQSGDFFESWMKRRAGVKDSGRLIPGHGGLFDRADGLLAVLFALALIALGDLVLTIADQGSLLPSPQ